MSENLNLKQAFTNFAKMERISAELDHKRIDEALEQHKRVSEADYASIQAALEVINSTAAVTDDEIKAMYSVPVVTLYENRFEKDFFQYPTRVVELLQASTDSDISTAYASCTTDTSDSTITVSYNGEVLDDDSVPNEFVKVEDNPKIVEGKVTVEGIGYTYTLNYTNESVTKTQD